MGPTKTVFQCFGKPSNQSKREGQIALRILMKHPFLCVRLRPGLVTGGAPVKLGGGPTAGQAKSDHFKCTNVDKTIEYKPVKQPVLGETGLVTLDQPTTNWVCIPYYTYSGYIYIYNIYIHVCRLIEQAH